MSGSPSPVGVIEQALSKRLNADCPDYWPDLGSWAADAVAALQAAGYTIEPKTGELFPLPSPPPRRLRTCVEAWPNCVEGEYNPACCRFPKSCSCTIYDERYVTEADLEPADARPRP